LAKSNESSTLYARIVVVIIIIIITAVAPSFFPRLSIGGVLESKKFRRYFFEKGAHGTTSDPVLSTAA